MDDVYKYILSNITNGKMDKQTAIKLISMLKKKRELHARDIAIVGIGTKLPLASDLDEFWGMVMSKGNYTRSCSKDRQEDIANYIAFSGEDGESEYYDGVFLDHIDHFDHEFFNIPPKEADLMDPNQRLLLETVWQAIEDGGYSGGKLAGSKTGVYVGFESGIIDSYARMVFQIEPSSTQLAIAGNLSSIVAGRLSYLLDLKGPSININSACSSSLIAVDLACQALENGSCKMAIAAGIRINLVPVRREISLGIEASDGVARSFDYHADGTSEGEGVAAVLLKPLDDAIRDRDNIYAVIKGHASNQDGNSAGVTSPNPASQADLMVAAWTKAGIDPETISFIETHGTATTMGDPIEIKGIQNAFGKFTRKKQFCAIGSIKPNIGHLFECSGIINLITAVWSIKKGVIPPSAYFNRPNAEIDFCKSPIYINTKPKKWEAGAIPRRCGVSAFGISGTNCHVVLEEAPKREENEGGSRKDINAFLISAGSEESLLGLITRYADYFNHEMECSLEDICYTASLCRGHYGHRIALLVKDLQDLKHTMAYLSGLNFEHIKNIREESLFYGYHKLVNASKKFRQDGEINRDMKQKLDEEAERCLEQYIAQGEEKSLKSACELYACGADPDWSSLYSDIGAYRVSLPTYCFQKKRCWIDIPKMKRTIGNPLYHKITWEESNEQSKDNSEITAPEGAVLVLKDEGIIADQVIERLTSEGYSVIVLDIKDRFEKTGPDKYTVKPDRESMRHLFEAIGNQVVCKVINLASVYFQKEINSLGELRDSQNRGFYSLMYLIQELMERNHRNVVEFLVFTSHVDEVTGTEEEFNPENAPLLGVCNVAMFEYPSISCRCVDIDKNTSIDNILDEIRKSGDTIMAAYRDGTRYVRQLTTQAPGKITYKDISIADDGTYLITGGTGGIGLEISKYLASKARVKLALVNRSKFPDRNEWDEILTNSTDSKTADKIRIIQEIISAGSEVHFYNADVSDAEEIEAVIERIRKECGRIRGIFHSAGVPGHGLIADKVESDMERVLNPKIYGTWLIHKLTQADTPDFMVLFSSVATVGGAGLSDYSAANSYLDTFSLYRNKLGLRTLSINWAPWKDTGMWHEHEGNKGGMFHSLQTEQAIAALDILMKSDSKNMFVTQIKYDAEAFRYFRNKTPFKLCKSMINAIENANSQYSFDELGQPDKGIILTGRGDESEYSETERTVAAIWNGVLGLNKYDIYNDFYEMGGDSIKALRLVNDINQKLNLYISASELFSNPTINEFSAYLDSVMSGSSSDDSKVNIYSGLAPVEKRAYYPLSSAQKRLFILDKAAKRNMSYNINRAFRMEGNIDVGRLEAAMNDLVKRHESLRTSFSIIDGSPVQIIHDSIDFQIEYEDCDESAVDEKIREFVDYFDLNVPKLFRVKVFNISSTTKILAFDMHHIITDGVTMDILISELAFLYDGKELPSLPIQYRDYAVWQQELLSDRERDEYKIMEEQEKYWLELYREKLPDFNIPTDFERPVESSFKGSYIVMNVDEPMYRAIKGLTLETKTTLNMVLLTAYYIFLSRCTGAEDIVVGIPVAGRQHASLENMVGLLVNTVALRAAPTLTKRVSDLLKEIKHISLEMQENQDYQFDDLVSRLGLKRESNRNALFDTMFVLQNVGLEALEIEGVKFSVHEYDTEVAKFDLLVEAFESDNKITFRWEFSTDLFKRGTVERFAQDYLLILSAFVENLDVTIGDIDLVDGNLHCEANQLGDDPEFEF